ncbi:zf-HC2 domain-containing protein [Kitasatospora sp. NPDC050463]|uniref:anti-sigma factor family protein n=1 Tax=Kitasatospora sp. NPDC050463 TaxID=3155786 RepID=UPI0033FBEC55
MSPAVIGNEEAHPAGALVEAYARGALPVPQVAGVERHLDRCAGCRAVLAGRPADGRTERAWTRLAEIIDAPRRSPAERALLRLGVPEHMARLAMATPPLRRSWLIASVVTLFFTVVAARLAPDASGPILLTAAPLIPLAGVALSYGPVFDPMYELGLVMPMQSLRLILYRSATVLVASSTLSSLVILALPRQGLAMFGWLAPALAVTLLALALSAHLDAATAARATGVCWLAVALFTGRHGGGRSLLLTSPGQLALLVLAVAAAAYIAVQRHRFEQASRWHTRRLTT